MNGTSAAFTFGRHGEGAVNTSTTTVVDGSHVPVGDFSEKQQMRLYLWHSKSLHS